MSILLCAGTISLSYGIYNMLCYLFMLPTATAENAISVMGRGKKQSFLDQVAILIAERMVKHWDLHWNNEEELERYLKEKAIYIGGTVYIISKGIKLAAGIMLFIPVAFMNRYMFLCLILIWIFCCGWDIKLLIFDGKKVNFLKSQKIKKFLRSIFLWIYSISNILLIIKLFT